jgi:hypothetical protein
MPFSLSVGNRCGHDPKRPLLAAAVPIPKGKGGLPRILSLAAERAKAWYFHPRKCPPLQARPDRQTRSERREACQIVLEVILRHLDLASMCLGKPTPANGFIDVDMRTIVHDTGIGQRRCERAIAMFKRAGFMKVAQPRTQNEEGAYFGCRAIRVVTAALFEWLDLGPMLARERRKASGRLRRKAQRAGNTVADIMRRLIYKRPHAPKPSQNANESSRLWNLQCAEYIRQGMDGPELRRRTNETLGYPPDYSPGQTFTTPATLLKRLLKKG